MESGKEPITPITRFEDAPEYKAFLERWQEMATTFASAEKIFTILDIVPDVVHVLFEGKIVKSGPKELALELEKRGYDWIKEEYEQGKLA